jgi:hypothetical protein
MLSRSQKRQSEPGRLLEDCCIITSTWTSGGVQHEKNGERARCKRGMGAGGRGGIECSERGREMSAAVKRKQGKGCRLNGARLSTDPHPPRYASALRSPSPVRTLHRPRMKKTSVSRIVLKQREKCELTFSLLSLHTFPKLTHHLPPGHAATSSARAQESRVLSAILDFRQTKLERGRQEGRERVGLGVIESVRRREGGKERSVRTEPPGQRLKGGNRRTLQ